MQQSGRLQQLIIFLVLALTTGCATEPIVISPITPEEQTRIDRDFGVKTAAELEGRLTVRSAPDITVYLRGLAEKLAASREDLKGSPVGVILISAPRGQGAQSFALPGGRIYFPVELLKQLEFENQVAAVLAFELAHLSMRHVIQRGGVEPGFPSGSTPFFGQGGLFDFTLDQELAAVERSVGILYAAGYDPRGLVSIWIKYQNQKVSGSRSAAVLERLVERTRLEITRYAPLLNPVVRTDEFLKLQNKIRKL